MKNIVISIILLIVLGLWVYYFGNSVLFQQESEVEISNIKPRVTDSEKEVNKSKEVFAKVLSWKTWINSSFEDEIMLSDERFEKVKMK